MSLQFEQPENAPHVLWAHGYGNGITYHIWAEYDKKNLPIWRVQIDDFEMFFTDFMEAKSYCAKRESERITQQVQADRTAMKETVRG